MKPSYFTSQGIGGLFLRLILSVWLIIVGSTWVHACELRVGIDAKIPQLIVPKAKPSSQEQEDYVHGLLDLILTRTEAEFGPCVLIQTDAVLTRMRSAALIDRSLGVDLFWGTASIARDNLLHAIAIPILEGLMTHKVFLIHKDDQAKFSAVKTLADLQHLRAGQGADWPDANILMANGIEVVTSTNYESLYKMLVARRFDFLPRGANQVLSELRYNADKNIVLEQELVMIYPAPVYFFVSKDKPQLAARIEKGLSEIMADGSFDEYFYRHPLILEALEKLKLQDRRPIYLYNPLLPKDSPREKSYKWMIPSPAKPES